MYKILVVDDEQIDRDGICFLIRSNKLDLMPVQSESAIKALEILKSDAIDILFTDIKMPMMSGIELIKQALSIKPQLQIVIYSAYSEFEYARTAMEMGVKNYLLKPIIITKFVELMRSIIDDCKQIEIDKYKKIVINSILFQEDSGTTCKIDFENWEYGKYLSLLELTAPLYGKYDFMLDTYIKEKYKLNYFTVILNEYQALLFLDSDFQHSIKFANTLMKDIETRYNQKSVFVYGGQFNNLEELRALYEKMDDVSESKFFIKDNIVFSIGHELEENIPNTNEFLKRADKIGQMLARKEQADAMFEMEKLFTDLECCNNIPTVIPKYVCMELIKSYMDVKNDLNSSTFTKYLHEIINSNTLQGLKYFCFNYILSDNVNEVGNRQVIDEVINIIHNEYMKNISLESISERVYLSPSYLSFLFKKETGQSFIKYQTNYRIEMAKNLIRTTTLKISLICEMVGYTNVSYFCMIFKNYTGYTPVQYRENII